MPFLAQIEPHTLIPILISLAGLIAGGAGFMLIREGRLAKVEELRGQVAETKAMIVSLQADFYRLSDRYSRLEGQHDLVLERLKELERTRYGRDRDGEYRGKIE